MEGGSRAISGKYKRREGGCLVGLLDRVSAGKRKAARAQVVIAVQIASVDFAMLNYLVVGSK